MGGWLRGELLNFFLLTTGMVEGGSEWVADGVWQRRLGKRAGQGRVRARVQSFAGLLPSAFVSGMDISRLVMAFCEKFPLMVLRILGFC